MSHKLRSASRIVIASTAVMVCPLGLDAIPASASSPGTLAVPETIQTVAGDGQRGSSGDGGPAVNAELSTPNGVALDLVGDLYIADSGNNEVRRVVSPTAAGQDLISTFAGDGRSGFSGDGASATAAELDSPHGIAVDGQGDVFIADTGNNRIREVTEGGTITTIAGDGQCRIDPGNGGTALQASLCSPEGVAVDSAGRVYVADTGHHEVRTVSGGTISALAGTGRRGYSGDGGPAIDARLSSPVDVSVNAGGDVFVADSADNAIREVSSPGEITTFAGTGRTGFSGDGGPANKAQLDKPAGLGWDSMGDVFIADTGNQRIREVDPSGSISTFAGRGRRGFSGDGGPAGDAELADPQGPLAAEGGAVYFSDSGNERVRGVFTGPPPALPESSMAIWLPVSAAAVLGGGGLALYRRRRRK